MEQRTIKEGLSVSVLGLGCGPLGGLYDRLDEEQASATVAAALDAGITYFDAAPLYGMGLAEHRLGTALRRRRDGAVISTKVGRLLRPAGPSGAAPSMFHDALPFEAVYDYSRDGVMRSIEGTLKRLGTDHVDMLAIHDPDEAIHFAPGEDPYARSRFSEAMDGAYPVLEELRSQGVVKAIGVGINQWQMLRDFVTAGRFDYFLLAGRYTLLEQEPLADLLPACAARSTRIIIGGPYNSGILATGARQGATFNTRAAPPGVLDRVARIEAVCDRHGVPLPAAALQFPLGHPIVASVIPGARSVSELQQNLDYIRHPIPAALWTELQAEGLVDAEAPLPAGQVA